MSNFRSNSRDVSSVVRIFVSFFVIVISIASIYVVVKKVSEIKILEKISLKAEPHDSITITTDTNAGTSLFITDEKGIKFRKEDKTFAREEWIDKNGELFYFDTAGYGLSGDLKKEGQVYTFENGKLKNIKRDTSYVYRADDSLYSSIESAQYLVWLDNEENKKGFYPIKYKMYADDSTDYLGTENDKQYASPNLVKIYMSDIYYLAAGKGTDFAGRLYRMRPGATHKETVGVGVTGYIILSDEVVYYCDGERVMKAQSWKGVEVDAIDPEEAELIDALTSVPGVATESEFIDEEDKIEKEIEKEIENIKPVDKSEKKEKVEVGVEPIISNLPVPDKKVIKETEPIAFDRPGVVEIGVAPH